MLICSRQLIRSLLLSIDDHQLTSNHKKQTSTFDIDLLESIRDFVPLMALKMRNFSHFPSFPINAFLDVSAVCAQVAIKSRPVAVAEKQAICARTNPIESDRNIHA